MAGNPIPGQLSDLDGFIDSISAVGSPVKIRITNQRDTVPFKKWFGDSKIVNADGTPKIVYRGTPAQFTISNEMKTKARGAP